MPNELWLFLIIILIPLTVWLMKRMKGKWNSVLKTGGNLKPNWLSNHPYRYAAIATVILILFVFLGSIGRDYTRMADAEFCRGEFGEAGVKDLPLLPLATSCMSATIKLVPSDSKGNYILLVEYRAVRVSGEIRSVGAIGVAPISNLPFEAGFDFRKEIDVEWEANTIDAYYTGSGGTMRCKFLGGRFNCGGILEGVNERKGYFLKVTVRAHRTLS